MVNNIDRANWAAEALQTFANRTSNCLIDEDSIADLVCDLGHYAQLGMGMAKPDVLRMFAIGIGAWLAEAEHPLCEPDNNKLVTITVAA